MTDLDWLPIGKIVAPQGLRGQVRVYPDTDFPERFLVPGQRWLLRPGEPSPQPIELVSGYYLPGKNLYVITLAGVNDRTQAERLRGAQFFVEAGDRPPLGEDEYHVLDLIGLEVWEQVTQRKIGIVVDVLAAGNDLLEVELEEPCALDAPVEAEEHSVVSLPTPSSLDENGIKTQAATSTIEISTESLTPEVSAPEVSSKKPKRVLVPFVRAIVPIVDLHRGRVEITPPDGLLD